MPIRFDGREEFQKHERTDWAEAEAAHRAAVREAPCWRCGKNRAWGKKHLCDDCRRQLQAIADAAPRQATPGS